MLLYEMNLTDIKIPDTWLTGAALEKKLSTVLGSNTRVDVKDGLLNVRRGPFPWDMFIKNGKLIAKFGIVERSSPNIVVRLNNLRTLEGSPIEVDGIVDIRSDMITSLEHGPKRVTSMFVEAKNLSSLRGMPLSSSIFSVSSECLTTLTELSGSHENLNFCSCKAVKNTNGLNDIEVDYIGLPVNLEEITEVPLAANSIGSNVTFGIAKLMLIKGLKAVNKKFPSDISGSMLKASTHVIDLLNAVIKEHDKPQDRYFRAQQELIDFGHGHLV